MTTLLIKINFQMFIGVCAVKISEICNNFVINGTTPNYCNAIKTVMVTIKKVNSTFLSLAKKKKKAWNIIHLNFSFSFSKSHYFHNMISISNFINLWIFSTLGFIKYIKLYHISLFSPVFTLLVGKHELNSFKLYPHSYKSGQIVLGRWCCCLTVIP